MNRLKVLNLTSNPLTPEQLANNGVEVEQNIRETIINYMLIDSIANVTSYIEKVADAYKCNAVYIDVPVARKIKIYKQLSVGTNLIGVVSLSNNGVHTRWINATNCLVKIDIPFTIGSFKTNKHKIYSVLNLGSKPFTKEQLEDNGYQFDDQSRTMFSNLINAASPLDLAEFIATLALDSDCDAAYVDLPPFRKYELSRLMLNTPIILMDSVYVNDIHTEWKPIVPTTVVTLDN